MTDKNFRVQRHLKLWEEQNKRVKRTMFACVLFCLFFILKVLPSFVDNSGKIKCKKDRIGQLEQMQENVEERKASLELLQTTMKNTQNIIKDEPWMDDKNKLITRLQEINNQGGSWPEYQQAADSTIRNITAQVILKIVQPMEKFLHKNPKARESIPGLLQGLETLRSDMNRWKMTRLGVRWYETYFEKDKEMMELTSSLQREVGGINMVIRSELSMINIEMQELDTEIDTLGNDIQTSQENIEELKVAMEKLLPSWLRGLFSIEHMIQFFPFILLGLLMYVLGMAYSLSKHHEFLIENIGLSEAGQKDPSTSSIWTLTRERRLGLVLTPMIYILFTLVIWIFFEQGCTLLSEWLRAEDEMAWIPKIGGISIVLWTGRSLIVIISILIFVYTFFPEKIISGRNKLKDKGKR